MYFDRDIPASIVELTRETEGHLVRILGVAEPNMDDREVWRAAIQAGAVLITHDDGFWNDRRYPLRDSPGVLIVKGGTASEILEAMERFTVGAGMIETERKWPGYFRATKVRATLSGFTVRFVTADSKVVTETYSRDHPASGQMYSTEPQD